MKGSVKLSDGREINIDVSTMTQKEWRNLWDGSVDDKLVDEAMARWTGLEPSDFGDMRRTDFLAVVRKVVMLGNSPLADPNSQSASTTE